MATSVSGVEKSFARRIFSRKIQRLTISSFDGSTSPLLLFRQMRFAYWASSNSLLIPFPTRHTSSITEHIGKFFTHFRFCNCRTTKPDMNAETFNTNSGNVLIHNFLRIKIISRTTVFACFSL